MKTMFEIAEMTELGKNVWEIVEDGKSQNKVIIISLNEWEEFEQWKTSQQTVARDTADYDPNRVADCTCGQTPCECPF